MTLRACPHDSGPLWVAIPFSVWLFHPLHLAGLSRRVIGLFHGMFEKNILTFNPGWDSNAQKLAKFTDVRELQRLLRLR